jgi:hypothetical protein
VSFAAITRCVASQRFFIVVIQRPSPETFGYTLAKCEGMTPFWRSTPVGIVLGYRLDDRGSRVRFPEGTGNFSFHHRVQNGSGAHPASYQIGTRSSFPGGKAVGA